MKLVISTCDKYRWIIPVTLYYFKKFWPDNPYDIEIITERMHIDGNVFYTRGVPWSSGIKKYLKQSKEDKLILVLEDHLIRGPISTRRVKRAENLCKGKVGHVRLNNAPAKYFNQHAEPIDIQGFREYPLYHRFSAGIQASIYQKQYLFDFLRNGHNPWEAEQRGAKQLKKLRNKWTSLWPKANIFPLEAVGLMKKGDVRSKVHRWMKRDLLENPTDEGKAIYKLVQDHKKAHCKREKFEVNRKNAAKNNPVFIDVGELGWSLYLNAHIRWLKQHTESKVGVFTLSDRKCLFDGLADVILDVPKRFHKKFDIRKQDSFKLRHVDWEELSNYFLPHIPEGYRIAEHNEYPDQIFSDNRIYKPYKYSRPPEKSKEILIFPRCRDGLWTRNNLPESFYSRLIRRLCDEFPKLTIRTIGTKAGAYDIKVKRANYINAIGNGRNIQVLIDKCQSAVAAIGSQSAPPKIALLQGVPTFMIGHQKDRHTKTENWMNTKVGFHEINKRGYETFNDKSCGTAIIKFVKEVLSESSAPLSDG